MHSMTVHTSTRNSIVRHDPEEGCRWRCTTCGNYLRGRTEVWGHWMLFHEGHSLFEELRTGRVCHQTIEGLHLRPGIHPGVAIEER